MRIDGVTSGASTMQHSESMHKSHHGGQLGQGDVSYGKDGYLKTEAVNKMSLYNEKGQIVTK